MPYRVSFAVSRRAIAVCLTGLALAAWPGRLRIVESSSSSSASTSGAQFQARLNLAKCFRAHGINVPDPSRGGGVAGGGGGIFRAAAQLPQAQITAARQACQQYFAQAFPQLNISPGPARAVPAAAREVRPVHALPRDQHPRPDDERTGGFGFRRAFRSIDRNSPAFQAANKACASLRPRFGRGGPGGGGPGGGPGA